MNDDDDRLKRAFGALRRHDERYAPPFRPPAAPPAKRSPGKVVVLFAAPVAALAVAAAAMLFVTRAERSAPASATMPSKPSVAAATAAADLAPLDFLLDVPAGSVIARRPVFDEREFGEVKR